MHINKLVVKNFKKIKSEVYEFNDDLNIFVGDNESGKSTLLEAIDLCVSLQYRRRPLAGCISQELFNNDQVSLFLRSDKSIEHMPEILIEAYLDEPSELKGKKNSLKEDVSGLFVRIFFNPELEKSYMEYLKTPDALTMLPIEFYTFEWYSFAWDKLTPYSKKISCLFVDPPNLQPTFGAKKYITDVLSTLGDEERAALRLNFRQLKGKFDSESAVTQVNENLDNTDEVTDKKLQISIENTPQGSVENNLQLSMNQVPFSHVGKGEQHQVLIKLALREKAENADVVLIEEPENHLSHINLVNLIQYIEDKMSGQQVFITTHSSYVLNKLSFEHLCLMAEKYVRLEDIDLHTVKTLKRLPGYDTLRAVLSQKIILVEGPSDELLLKKIYFNENQRLPEADKIDIIVVRGIGFKNYLNIVHHLGNSVHVVKDNDGNYSRNIIEWANEYSENNNIKVFSPENNNLNSLEPALIDANASDATTLDKFAKVILSSQTYNKYDTGDLRARQEFLTEWFGGSQSGAKKVDSAIRAFDSDVEIKFPEYLKKALCFA
ncbi:MAG: AAA family ATPase [Hyphomicrobiales bacterium]